MGRPGATLKVSFSKAWVYRLTTKFGEDYTPMGETVGEDQRPPHHRHCRLPHAARGQA
jgi:hypothetical protein